MALAAVLKACHLQTQITIVERRNMQWHISCADYEKKAVLTQTLEVHKLRSSSILMAPNFFHAYALEAAFQICLKTNKVRGLQFQNELVLRADHHAIPNQMPYSGQTNSLI